jgi:hypothetical protein
VSFEHTKSTGKKREEKMVRSGAYIEIFFPGEGFFRLRRSRLNVRQQSGPITSDG